MYTCEWSSFHFYVRYSILDSKYECWFKQKFGNLSHKYRSLSTNKIEFLFHINDDNYNIWEKVNKIIKAIISLNLGFDVFLNATITSVHVFLKEKCYRKYSRIYRNLILKYTTIKFLSR